MSVFQSIQTELIEASFDVGALKFGSFVLKSGRVSPYFFNAGLLSTGRLLSVLAAGYAACIARSSCEFDVIFGPAYKGISLAAVTALILHRDHNIDVGFAYDRKEIKDHGEGGKMVGSDVKAKKVLILDDVMTAGTAVRSSIDLIQQQGGHVVGVVMALDREEIGPQGGSTVNEIDTMLGGKGKVQAILKMRDLNAWLEKNGREADLQTMKAYWNEYGVKD